MEVERTKITQNFQAIHVNADIVSAYPTGIYIRRNLIDTTATPAAIGASALGGNGVTAWGPVQHLYIEENEIYSVGRMAIELFPGDALWLAAGHHASFHFVRRNKIRHAHYRSISTYARVMEVTGNEVIGAPTGVDWLEISGETITVERNHLVGAGFTPNVGITGVVPHAVTYSENRFEDAPGFHGFPLRVYQWPNVKITRNTFKFSNPVPGGHTVFSCIDLRYLTNLVCEDNDIEFHGTCNRQNIYNFGTIKGGRILRNKVRLYNVAAGGLESIGHIFSLDGVNVSNNETWANQPVLTNGFVVEGLGDGYGTFWRWATADGAAWVKGVVQGIANDPPATPAADDVWAVGDAPTGVWIGHARTFATWDGSAWSHQPITDCLLHTETVGHALPGGDTYLPRGARAGEAYLLNEGGILHCVFEGNDFSGRGTVRPVWGWAYYGMWSYGSRPNFWGSTFRANHGPVRIEAAMYRGTVEMPPALTYPAGYYPMGVYVPAVNVGAAGCLGWVRATDGSDAAGWKPVGVVAP